MYTIIYAHTKHIQTNIHIYTLQSYKQINHIYTTKGHNSDLLLSDRIDKVLEVLVVPELGLGYEVVELN